MKICTDIKQSKRLAELLPIESADMWYWEWPTAPKYNNYEHPMFHKGDDIVNVPCWSLAALIEAMPKQLGRYTLTVYWCDGYWCCSYIDDGSEIKEISSANNLVDACYEMILKLNK